MSLPSSKSRRPFQPSNKNPEKGGRSVGRVRGILATVLLASLLGGCSGSADEPVAAPKYHIPEVHIEEKSPFGAIAGVVLEITIRPIPFANITLEGANLTTTADADGGFTFENLRPGFYYFTGKLKGYVTTTSQVEVFAGEAARARIGLPRLPYQKPYHETLPFHGYVDAAAFLSTCECSWYIDGPEDVRGFTIEATWVPSGTCVIGDQFDWTLRDTDGDRHSQSGTMGNPLLAVVNRTAEWLHSFRFEVRVMPDATCVRAQQPFEVYVTIWHNGPAPPDWSFVDGDK